MWEKKRNPARTQAAGDCYRTFSSFPKLYETGRWKYVRKLHELLIDQHIKMPFKAPFLQERLRAAVSLAFTKQPQTYYNKFSKVNRSDRQTPVTTTATNEITRCLSVRDLVSAPTGLRAERYSSWACHLLHVFPWRYNGFFESFAGLLRLFRFYPNDGHLVLPGNQDSLESNIAHNIIDRGMVKWEEITINEDWTQVIETDSSCRPRKKSSY